MDSTPTTPPNTYKKLPWDNWQAAPSNSFVYQVQNGRIGKNHGINNGLGRLNRYLHGTHKGRMYLIGADSGVGKTTLTDFMFIFSAYREAKATGRKLKIIYYSFEIPKVDKEAKWVCHYIYMQYGISLTPDYVLGRITGVSITEEHLAYVMEAYEQVQDLMSYIIFSEDAVHPTKIFEDIVEHFYSKHGVVHRTAVSEADKKAGKKGRVVGYTSNEPDMMVLMIMDHLALLHTELNLTLKQTMDKMSRYCVILRNMFGLTSVLIQQFSTDLLAMKREAVKFKGSSGAADIVPNRLDFGDTKATFRDADVVMGLVKPLDFGLPEYQGWSTSSPMHPEQPGLGAYLIAGFLMKNRYGPANKRTEWFLNPVAGVFYDLPTTLGDEDEWYEKAKKLEIECQSYSQKEL